MPAERTFRVLAISGSLRRGSYNTAAVRAAVELAPPTLALEPLDLATVPPFDPNADEDGWPAGALALLERAAAADALLIATPEHNYSVPAALKSALDWLSRTPPGRPGGWTAVAGKPLAILGASPGRVGTARAQLHLRQIATYLDLRPLNKPEVLIAQAADKFDAGGRLTDDFTRRAVAGLLAAFAAACGRS